MRRIIRILVIAFVAGLGLYLLTRRDQQSAAPAPTSAPLTQVPPAAPAATAAKEVPIEDRKTIDFSKGSAEVRATPADQAAIDAAVREMEEATKDISFGSPPKKSAP